MPAPKTTSINTAATSAAKFASLETQMGNISSTLHDFVTESKEYRARAERNESQIWIAIREQGERMNTAIEKLSTNGRISWGMIVSTGGFILALIGSGAAVNHALTESRMKQVEIRAEAAQKDLDRIYEERHRQLTPSP